MPWIYRGSLPERYDSDISAGGRERLVVELFWDDRELSAVFLHARNPWTGFQHFRFAHLVDHVL